jgi:hypothetical protein
MPFKQYKHLQRMSKNEFSIWCESFGKDMWEQGYQEAHKGMQEVPENARIIDTTDTMIIDMDYDELYNKILSVKGVGPALCERILDKLYEEYDGYIKTTQDNPE